MSNAYQHSIIVNASPAAAYAAVTRGYRQWWAPASAPFDREGDTATFCFADTTWTFRATALQPDRTVTLLCTDADHHHDGLPESIRKEWLDSRLEWRIEPAGDQTRITLTHHGLTPDLACYAVCAQGWDFYFVRSLQRLLDEGIGMPYTSGD